jgi:hypothetical protein
MSFFYVLTLIHLSICTNIVHAHIPGRPSTPQLRSIPNDHIEQEPAVILNSVQHHHTTHPVNPKDAVADIKLVMLGLELDKQAKASDGKTTLRSIVETDIGKLSRSVVAMVAPSGSGKTATKLHSHLVSQRLGLVIAVDEAQMTENDILAGKLISPTALMEYRDNRDAILEPGPARAPPWFPHPFFCYAERHAGNAGDPWYSSLVAECGPRVLGS